MSASRTPSSVPRTLALRLEGALRQGPHALEHLAGAEPKDERDRLLALHTILDLHLSPVDTLGPAVRWQHHPVVAELKYRLEVEELEILEADDRGPADYLDAVSSMRAIARDGLVPPVYDWLAEESTWDELVTFLAIEGGPDAGFDDLVAACQIGIAGRPKMEMARNYWDEMGRGDSAGVHTHLHRRLTEAIAMPRVPRREMPTTSLRRTALGGILATNRYLQREFVGALGLLEMQAGPRCRRVVRALERLDAPEAAFPFYVEHAEVDPHHGKAWLDEVVAPLGEDTKWAAGIIRGARWRSVANAAFFADVEAHVRTDRGVAAGAPSDVGAICVG